MLKENNTENCALYLANGPWLSLVSQTKAVTVALWGWKSEGGWY